jgi:hypothetical protein
MRWFTRRWHGGQMSEATVERVRKDYFRHLAELRPHLPKQLLIFARDNVRDKGYLSMHDGHFISVQAPATVSHRLIFDIACWDMAHGTLADNRWSYPDLHVRFVYDGAELLTPKTLRTLERRTRNAETVILYDEFDRAPNGKAFEHRMLLWPPEAGFVAVRFLKVGVSVVRFEGTKATVLPTE